MNMICMCSLGEGGTLWPPPKSASNADPKLPAFQTYLLQALLQEASVSHGRVSTQPDSSTALLVLVLDQVFEVCLSENGMHIAFGFGQCIQGHCGSFHDQMER